MICLRNIALALVTVMTLGQAVQAQSFPDHYDNYVNDFADLLDREEERRLREMLEPLRENHGIEFVVVTIHRMSDYGHQGPIEPFATRLFNYWGVGNAERNDGVMMLVSRQDRVMRIEVGSGYGTSKDAAMKDIIDDAILSRFRRGQYPEGIERGVELVIRDLTGFYPGEESMNFLQRSGVRIADFFRRLGGWSLLVIGSILPFPMIAWRRWRRNRPRICPNDQSKMYRMDEFEDDSYLEPGQQTEERLNSKDYDVWQCRQCAHLTIEGYRAWFSFYKACGACGFRTLEGDTTILVSATTSSTGKKRIDYYCHNCQHTYSETRIIPRRSESSSSSGSSGGSSFGGGSSSGGGASGSW